ncbi:MAG: EAL domain-containing protein [Halieaceae bacterium]
MTDMNPGPGEQHNELIDVENKQRRQLTIILWMIVLLVLITFDVVTYLDGRRSMSLALTGCTAVCIAYLLYEKFAARNSLGLLIPNLSLGLLAVILLVTGGKENTGPLFIYPLITAGVLINRFKVGAILGLGLAVLLIGILFSLDASETTARYNYYESTRFVMTLLILLATALIGSYLQEKAKKQMQSLHQDVHQLAYYDSLTGLANRSNFRSWLQRMLDRAREEGSALALIYIDLDDFKQVNDRCGHQVGDRLLAEFGRRLGECVRPNDGTTRLVADEDVARLAGDEFIVTLPDVEQPADAEAVAKRILTLFDGGFEVDGLQLPVTCSIGIAYVQGRVENAEKLLNYADAAMYKAKERGKNNYQFFSDTIARDIRERHCIEAGLQDALSRDDFNLLYMPIYDSEALSVVGCEVLLRCESPILPGIGPDRFIPVAEATGLIKPIDLWVLDNAMAGMRRLQDERGFDGVMCINISAVELHNTEFPQQVGRLLTQHGVSADRIELEVTETSLVASDQASQLTLERLRELGVGLALDDFGTGYTAFNQLMNYPVNCLKIDRSFVDALFSDNHAHCKMVDVVQHLGQLYGLRVIAEGVETDQQMSYLREIGCDWLQGYHLSRPLEYEDFASLLMSPSQAAASSA